MAPASAQTHAHNPASYGAYPECVSLRSRPKVPNQDPRAASGPCLLRVPALQERSPRSPVCEARRRRKDPPVLRPQRPLFASFRPREQTLQERRPLLLPLPGNSAGSSLLHPYLLLLWKRSSFITLRLKSYISVLLSLMAKSQTLDVVSSFKEESSFQTAQTPHPNTVSYNTSSGELFPRIDVSTRAITSRSDTGSGANSRIPTHGRAASFPLHFLNENRCWCASWQSSP